MSVSALILTYNHERFIAQAIESALMQEVGSAYEIVIADDCSTDRTREIVEDYAGRYPDRIRALLRRANLGGAQNFVDALRGCQGEYIAYLDGDDYWISPHKLQAQLEFFRAHPECAMCSTGVFEIYEDDDRSPWRWLPAHQPEVAALEDLLLENFVYACTAMFRRGTFREYPAWVYDFPLSDIPLWVQVASHGQIGFIPDALATYRVHGGGMWSGKSAAAQAELLIELCNHLNEDLGFAYDGVLSRAIAKYRCQLACERAQLPQDAAVAVVTGGDAELLKIGRPSSPFSVSERAQVVRDDLRSLPDRDARYLLVPLGSVGRAGSRTALLREAAALYPLVCRDSHVLVFDCRADS